MSDAGQSGRDATSLTMLERARANDPDAWARVLGLYRPLVAYWCSRAGVAPADVDDVTQEVFAAAGSEPFTSLARGKPMKMAYWRLVDSAYDDPEDLKRWALLGLFAARGADAAKKAKAKGPRAVRKTRRK